VIASTGFLPSGNDMEAGGDAVLIGLQRARQMVVAERDTYRRVYAPTAHTRIHSFRGTVCVSRGKSTFRGWR
jgi:hypothetical protein